MICRPSTGRDRIATLRNTPGTTERACEIVRRSPFIDPCKALLWRRHDCAFCHFGSWKLPIDANSTVTSQDQWQRKKQTKEEARAAKMAKLDPGNNKSVKDVLDEQVANARKRKRGEVEDPSDVETVEAEKPLSKLAKKGKLTKKQTREEKGAASKASEQTAEVGTNGKESELREEVIKKAKTEKKKEKRELKKVKEEARIAKAKAKAEKVVQEVVVAENSEAAAGKPSTNNEESKEDQDELSDNIEIGDIVKLSRDQLSSTATPSTSHSPAFDVSANRSGSSSISSIAPPPTNEEPTFEKSNHEPKPPKPDSEEFKARLQHRIDELRSARKADGLGGVPARTRQELMEARRAKEEQRKAHKKELRQKAKEEEQRKLNETLARGSPLLSGSPLVSPASPLRSSGQTNNFSFSRINFPSGEYATASLNAILDPKAKPKGPSDPRTALLAAQNKQSRINGLDEAKRADIAEKDTWLNARKRAHGERIRDDTSLLKKTLKRKEKAKKKSEREWNERLEGVRKGQDLRQKKREANLQKRKEEKGGKGKKNGGKGGARKGKPKARPGFEGSFRAKNPPSSGEKRQ